MIPDKNLLIPNPNIKTICYIKNLPKRDNVIIGDYTYYSDNNKCPQLFYDNIEHHYDFIGDKLIIGKFCAIAEGTKFIMNGANHKMKSISTYPFNLFNWKQYLPKDLPYKGDTIIGNDVWIGQNSIIMPGIKIGNGSIIGANSVVSKNVCAYSIWAGNPAKKIKKRFTDEKISQLQEMAWWDWEYEKILKNIDILTNTI